MLVLVIEILGDLVLVEFECILQRFNFILLLINTQVLSFGKKVTKRIFALESQKYLNELPK